MNVGDIPRRERYRVAAKAGDADYFRQECLELCGRIALLSRENAALRARIEPIEVRIHELEVDNQVLRQRCGAE